MSTEQQQQQTTSPATGVTKKHTRSRGRAKRAQDPYVSVYGIVPLEMLRCRPWVEVAELDNSTLGKDVLTFGIVVSVRPVAIVVLLSISETVRCTVVAGAGVGVTTRMVRFAATMRRGTLIEVEGVVSPSGIGRDLVGTTQKVKIMVRRLHAIGTLKDGTVTGATAESSSGSFGARPSITMMEENQVGREGEISRAGQGKEQQQTTSATGVTKKHTRSRGRAKRPQDPYASVYGIVPLEMLRWRPWVEVGELDSATVGKDVLTFGIVVSVRPVTKTCTIVVLLSTSETVRCMVVAGADQGVTTRMVRFAATMRRGTLIDVEGVVSPSGSGRDLVGTTQPVEIAVRKPHAIGKLKDGSVTGAIAES